MLSYNTKPGFAFCCQFLHCFRCSSVTALLFSY